MTNEIETEFFLQMMQNLFLRVFVQKLDSTQAVSISNSKKWHNVYCKKDPRQDSSFILHRLSRSVQTNKEINNVKAPIFLSRASPQHLLCG